MPNALRLLYKSSLALLTDLYQLTMAYGYWKAGNYNQEASFNLHFRTAPFQGRYAVCAGLNSIIEFLDHFQFDDSDIDYLATLISANNVPLFSKEFLAYLKKLEFNCDIDAVEEGTLVFPHEPLIRIKGPLLQCQLLETPLLNFINFQTLVATKASRVCSAAEGKPVFEFGLRRAQGIDGGIHASRAAYLGGCVGTSNLLAGKLYNIPVKGTHAHSWVMAFPTEKIAFKAQADALPNNCIFLVDTYDTLEGVKHAIEIGNSIKQRGHRLQGIRLDSGDLAYLSIEARKLLDAAGFNDTVIIGSNDLDEHIIYSLNAQGAKIDIWGVGTRLITAFDQPALDGVYKLTALRQGDGKWQGKIKLSEQAAKISIPGLTQVRRFYDGTSIAITDVIYDEELGIPIDCVAIDPFDNTHRRHITTAKNYEDLLKPIFRGGKLIYHVPTLEQSRQKVQKELTHFHESIHRFLNPHFYPVGLEQQLYDLRTKLIFAARGL